MTQQPPPSQAPSARYDQQHGEYWYEPKKMTGLVRDDPWSQGAPLGAIPLQYRPPAPRSPAKTRRRKWPWSIGVLLLLVVIVGNYSRSSTTDFTPITHRVASSMAQPLTPAHPSATTTPSVVEPATSSVRNMSFGDGFWIVGEDIAPGIYESGGAQPDSFGLCLVTAHSGTDKRSDMLNAAKASPREPVRVSLDGNQVRAVEASGCENFTKVG